MGDYAQLLPKGLFSWIPYGPETTSPAVQQIGHSRHTPHPFVLFVITLSYANLGLERVLGSFSEPASRLVSGCFPAVTTSAKPTPMTWIIGVKATSGEVAATDWPMVSDS